MKSLSSGLRTALPVVVLAAAVFCLTAAEPQVSGLIRQTNGEILLTSAADAGAFYRIDTSADLQQWSPLVTLRSTGTNQLVDTASPHLGRRFYRATALSGTGIITGDHLQTDNGDAILHPIGHASVLVTWNGKVFYSDPSNSNNNSPRFSGLPLADVIVVTHFHGDHFDSSRLTALLKPDPGTTIFAPQIVFDMMPSTPPARLRSRTTVLANGATGNAHDMTVRAIAMYNLDTMNQPTGPHNKGEGNGYVVTMGGKNLYFSGDTEDIPEMRALTGIDAAFICMSLPSNMTETAAASAVREFRPRIVFPYHYRQSITYDINLFKSLVGTDLGIEARLRNFYP